MDAWKSYRIIILLDWVQVGMNMQCKGGSRIVTRDGKVEGKWKNTKYHKYQAAEGCAGDCSGISSMFMVFGCGSDGFCKCACEVSASYDGTCKLKRKTGFHIFKYVAKGLVFKPIFYIYAFMLEIRVVKMFFCTIV